MNIALPARLDFDEFLAWAALQEEGKYELIDGVVVMQQSQQWSHAKTKAIVLRALLMEAVASAGLPFYVAPDGPTIRISKRKGFVPDALVAATAGAGTGQSRPSPNPVIVVEVLSPSTAKVDATTKLAGYFEVPSIQHYLVVDAEGRTITHHKRAAGDVLETRIVERGYAAGSIRRASSSTLRASSRPALRATPDGKRHAPSQGRPRHRCRRCHRRGGGAPLRARGLHGLRDAPHRRQARPAGRAHRARGRHGAGVRLGRPQGRGDGRA